jgi:hypothetical protein
MKSTYLVVLDLVLIDVHRPWGLLGNIIVLGHVTKEQLLGFVALSLSETENGVGLLD